MPDQSPLDVVSPIARDSSGPTLVLFLAGLTGSASQWQLVLPLLDDLRADFAYGAPILPHPVFNGGKPTVTALAEAIGKELRRENRHEVIVVAHSVGAFVAMGLARSQPEVVRKVILVNGGLTSVAKFLDHPVRELISRPRTCLSALRLFVLVSAPAPAAVKRAIVRSEKSSRALLGGLVSSAALDSEERRRRLMDTGGSRGVIRALWDNRHHWREFADHVGEVKPEVLFLVGDQDPMAGEADTIAMAAMLPHAEIRRLPGVGHAAPLETAEAVAEAIRESLPNPSA